ncbi:glycosyltransferase family 2 protein [Corynebacterium uterequi]|uniref:Putative glycosyltransferase n=1 Tax=Corynebacterium uterequi TaxID=1072256 RepID=A0A0G3HEW4_9CORY|nr:glycosyltransferase family 2 protein [Corynebacterium uterequi]AKK10513.1 putative glycosyltransferase [Corynebacterium uterequi]
MKLSTPVTVVTVTYSPGRHLAAFLDSLAGAYAGPVRVIVVDNGSTDGAPEAAAAADDRVELLSGGGNVGYGAAMNAGVRHAGAGAGDVLILANPDVVFEPGAIDALVEVFERYPQAASAGPRIVEADGSTYPSARRVPSVATGVGHALWSKVWPGNPWTRRYRADAVMDVEREAGWLSGSCLAVRREAFSAVGGFDERYFMYLEDVDLGDRFGRAGYLNVYTPAARIRHEQGHSTKPRAASMVPAHHRSAYRFQADRHPGWAEWPLRALLWAGLRARAWLLTRPIPRR